jgi:hypothetical protein
MPLDPESLILMPNPLAATLSGLNPLDPDVRMAVIEAVRRIQRRYTLSAEERKGIGRIGEELGREKWGTVTFFVALDPPDHFPTMEQEEIDARLRRSLFWLDDPADRRLLHRRYVEREMAYTAACDLLRWLRAHPKGATPAEVDLLASLHDEFIHTNVQTAWANLLSTLDIRRAVEVAKTTPDHYICARLVGLDPEGGAIFDARFPNWAEDEKRREHEYLDSLDDDDFP